MSDQHDNETSFTAPTIEELAELFPGHSDFSFIAQGGMGAVYYAVQNSLDREVALKILPKELAQDEEFREQFQAEAKAMAKLNHPTLIAIYDFGQAGDYLFISMEFVKGKALHYSIYVTSNLATFSSTRKPDQKSATSDSPQPQAMVMTAPSMALQDTPHQKSPKTPLPSITALISSLLALCSMRCSLAKYLLKTLPNTSNLPKPPVVAKPLTTSSQKPLTSTPKNVMTPLNYSEKMFSKPSKLPLLPLLAEGL